MIIKDHKPKNQSVKDGFYGLSQGDSVWDDMRKIYIQIRQPEGERPATVHSHYHARDRLVRYAEEK